MIRIRRHYSCALLSAIALMLSHVASSSAQTPPVVDPESVDDLFTQPLIVSNKFNGGYFRASLTSADPIPDDWNFSLEDGMGHTRNFNRANIKASLIGMPSSREILLDLPAIPGSRITASSQQKNLKLSVVALVHFSQMSQQQMINNGKIDMFDGDVDGTIRALGPSFGRLDMLSSSGATLGVCTAFRVQTKLWMSAAHCVARSDERDDVARWRIQPLDYMAEEGGPPYWAVPIATGQKDGKADPSAAFAPEDLDYALFSMSDDPGGRSLTLADNGPPAEGTLMDLLQHWNGAFGPHAGKGRSTGKDCKVYHRYGAKDTSYPELCPNGFQHGCSSDEGASGGPLIDIATLKVLAIHLGGGLPKQFNCSIEISTVIKSLCKSNNAIAKEIGRCP